MQSAGVTSEYTFKMATAERCFPAWFTTSSGEFCRKIFIFHTTNNYGHSWEFTLTNDHSCFEKNRPKTQELSPDSRSWIRRQFLQASSRSWTCFHVHGLATPHRRWRVFTSTALPGLRLGRIGPIHFIVIFILVKTAKFTKCWNLEIYLGIFEQWNKMFRLHLYF